MPLLGEVQSVSVPVNLLKLIKNLSLPFFFFFNVFSYLNVKVFVFKVHDGGAGS